MYVELSWQSSISFLIIWDCLGIIKGEKMQVIEDDNTMMVKLDINDVANILKDNVLVVDTRGIKELYISFKEDRYGD